MSIENTEASRPFRLFCFALVERCKIGGELLGSNRATPLSPTEGEQPLAKSPALIARCDEELVE
jgi:hypothetical protein